MQATASVFRRPTFVASLRNSHALERAEPEAVAEVSAKELPMTATLNNPLDTDPAEGSREVVERELKRQERKQNEIDHLPGVNVSGQPQGGAVDRANAGEKKSS